MVSQSILKSISESLEPTCNNIPELNFSPKTKVLVTVPYPWSFISQLRPLLFGNCETACRVTWASIRFEGGLRITAILWPVLLNVECSAFFWLPESDSVKVVIPFLFTILCTDKLLLYPSTHLSINSPDHPFKHWWRRLSVENCRYMYQDLSQDVSGLSTYRYIVQPLPKGYFDLDA